MNAARWSRRRRAAVLALPLAVGVIAAAPLAQAAITNPGSNGIQYTQDTTIDMKATVRSGSASLSLTDPNGAVKTVVPSRSGTLSYSFDTGCYPDCGSYGRHPALNGSWTVTESGSENDSKTFSLRIPPHAAASVSAQLTATREITLTWDAGLEPDLTGWTVVDGSGGGVLRQLATSDCTRTCRAVFGYNADDEGDRSFAVVSHRAACPGCSDVLDGPKSATATATLPPKPAPSPTPSPTPPPSQSPAPAPSPTDSAAAGGSGGTTGGSTGSPAPSGSAAPGKAGSGGTGGSGGTVSRSTGGSTGSGTTGSSNSTGSTGSVAIGSSTKTETVQAQRKAFALSFSSFAPKLGIAKLPPLPQALAPTLASEGLPADGTFQQTLGYKDVVKREKITTVTQAARSVSSAVTNAVDSQTFMSYMAGALVLFLLAAHLRRWLASPSDGR